MSFPYTFVFLSVVLHLCKGFDVCMYIHELYECSVSVCVHDCVNVFVCLYVVQEIVVVGGAHSSSFYKTKGILDPRRDEFFNISMPFLVINYFYLVFSWHQ